VKTALDIITVLLLGAAILILPVGVVTGYLDDRHKHRKGESA
jgi:hypothetical protein